MKINRIKRDWSKWGYGFNEWTDLPGAEYSNLVEGEKIILLVEGALVIETAQYEAKLVVGKEHIIQAGVQHTLKNPGPTSNKWYYGYIIEEGSPAQSVSTTLSQSLKNIFVAPKKNKKTVEHAEK